MTTTTNPSSYTTLSHFLTSPKGSSSSSTPDALVKCLTGLIEAARAISQHLRDTPVLQFSKTTAHKLLPGQQQTAVGINEFGDEQLSVDLWADRQIFAQLKQTKVVCKASSEEVSTEVDLGGLEYCVAFDPIDGSSIFDTNFSVGTIFAVWPGNTFMNQTGRSLHASGAFLYGSRTTLILATAFHPHALEFTLSKTADNRLDWIWTNQFTSIQPGKLFAPGNLRATQYHPKYNDLINSYIQNKYQLRYTGGMVPDVLQLLTKGRGVFFNPHCAPAPAKLRLVFEVIPLAFVVEKAGGASSNGQTSILDIPILDLKTCTQVCYGAKQEVDKFNAVIGPADT